MTSQEFLQAYPGIEFKKYGPTEVNECTYLGAFVPKWHTVSHEIVADKCAEHFGFCLGVIDKQVEASHSYGLFIKAYNDLTK